MSDQEVNVKISADVKSLLQGMKEASEHVETATAGIKGDLGSMIKSFEHFGTASLAIAAAGLAFEALKEAKDTIIEAVHATNELTESFESLNKRTGASFEDLSLYKNALVLTGGTMGDLSGILNGLARKMAASPEIYVANKIAADELALSQQDLMTTLAKSVHAIAAIHEPGRRSEVAIALLGSRAQAILPQIMKMNEMIEKEGPAALKKFGAHIDEDAIAKLDQFELATGTTKLNIEAMDQKLADSGRSWANWGNQIHLAWLRVLDVVTLGDGELPDPPKPSVTPGGDHGKATSSGHGEGGGKSDKRGVIPKELDEEKKAAEERLALRKAANAEIIRSADYVLQEQMKNDKELVASGAMTFAELEADMRQNYKERRDTVMAALKDDEKANAKKLIDLDATLAKEKQAQEKYAADLLDIGRQGADQGRKEKEKADAEAEKARKENLKYEKLAAQDELNLQKSVLEAKERALDQGLAFGRINEAQWTAAKKAGIAERLRADLEELNKAQLAAKNDLNEWKTIENQKSALRRKADGDIEKLDIKAVNRTKARWDGFFGSMTGGWDSAVKGLVKGTMTWGNALDEVLNQGLDGLISFFVRWGEEEAIKRATSLAMGSTGRVAEAEGAAAVYAVNAMGSVAAIPFWGWAAAPEVGAAAYGEGLAMAGLASAAGGWERVPSDQVAQLHKNEQVLPASYAEGLRSMVASHQAGEGQKSSGGDTHVHFHGALIDSTFWQKHQGPIVRTLNDAIKNRRNG